MFRSSPEIYIRKENITPFLEYDPKRKNFPIKEEPEGHEKPIYGEDLGNYIDKLNFNIEKLKENFGNVDENLQENHKKNFSSITSASEYFDPKQLETNNKLKLVPLLNFSKSPIHDRGNTYDPKNVFLSKQTFDSIEEEASIQKQQRHSVLNMEEKQEDFFNRIFELEKKNKEIKDFLEQTENERTQLQEEIKKVSSEQKSNQELLMKLLFEQDF